MRIFDSNISTGRIRAHVLPKSSKGRKVPFYFDKSIIYGKDIVSNTVSVLNAKFSQKPLDRQNKFSFRGPDICHTVNIEIDFVCWKLSAQQREKKFKINRS